MCGIVGISNMPGVSFKLYDALLTIQNRGENGTGMLTYDKDHSLPRIHRGPSLVSRTYQNNRGTSPILTKRLRGDIGIGHVRYPTSGSDPERDAQPFYMTYPFVTALAHNGNVTNVRKLRQGIQSRGRN